MGTNYYLETNVCEHCQRSEETLHLGKSSCGWHFSLCSVPEMGLVDLNSWIELFDKPNNVIVNEYGEKLSKEEMLDIITNRGWEGKAESLSEEFLRENSAEIGLNGLLAHKSSPYRWVKRTDGTYDLIEGVFS